MSSSVGCHQEENFTHFSNYHFNLKKLNTESRNLEYYAFFFLKKKLSDKN